MTNLITIATVWSFVVPLSDVRPYALSDLDNWMGTSTGIYSVVVTVPPSSYSKDYSRNST